MAPRASSKNVRCVFSNAFILHHPWARRIDSDQHSARCTFFNSIFSLSNMRIQALKSHEKSEEHRKNVELLETTHVITKSSSSPNLVSLSTNSGQNRQQIASPHFSSFFRVSDVISILADCDNGRKDTSLPLSIQNDQCKIDNCILLGNENASCSKMDPSSQIFSKLNLSKAKISHNINFGIASNSENELMSALERCDALVLGFDESLNKSIREQQMDLVVRFWYHGEDRVDTRYLTSAFLTRTRAVDLFGAIIDKIPTPLLELIIEVSMDGPNVNWVVHRELEKLIKGITKHKQLIYIGSRTLPGVHNSFKKGFTIKFNSKDSKIYDFKLE
ncbi:hypothetical protein QAD02_013405 [Eretmocerus hayati]|uniref:Uncharacterized protein n=1 Tax=Eretmocerus hayati TaxID=131215 RepID=A0ACC2P2C1_9HYME|nr:hypothetical protein QAD02_013405 [Eretmocerus hayati]